MVDLMAKGDRDAGPRPNAFSAEFQAASLAAEGFAMVPLIRRHPLVCGA